MNGSPPSHSILDCSCYLIPVWFVFFCFFQQKQSYHQYIQTHIICTLLEGYQIYIQIHMMYTLLLVCFLFFSSFDIYIHSPSILPMPFSYHINTPLIPYKHTSPHTFFPFLSCAFTPIQLSKQFHRAQFDFYLFCINLGLFRPSVLSSFCKGSFMCHCRRASTLTLYSQLTDHISLWMEVLLHTQLWTALSVQFQFCFHLISNLVSSIHLSCFLSSRVLFLTLRGWFWSSPTYFKWFAFHLMLPPPLFWSSFFPLF